MNNPVFHVCQYPKCPIEADMELETDGKPEAPYLYFCFEHFNQLMDKIRLEEKEEAEKLRIK